MAFLPHQYLMIFKGNIYNTEHLKNLRKTKITCHRATWKPPSSRFISWREMSKKSKLWNQIPAEQSMCVRLVSYPKITHRESTLAICSLVGIIILELLVINFWSRPPFIKEILLLHAINIRNSTIGLLIAYFYTQWTRHRCFFYPFYSLSFFFFFFGVFWKAVLLHMKTWQYQ